MDLKQLMKTLDELKTAHNDLARVIDTYRTAWKNARNAGWSAAQLKSFGATQPPRTIINPILQTDHDQPTHHQQQHDN